MTQSNICKCGHDKVNHHQLGTLYCEEFVNAFDRCLCISFTPEKDKQSSDASLSDKPESRENKQSSEKAFSYSSSKSGISILTASEIISKYESNWTDDATVEAIELSMKQEDIENEKFLPLSILESKKAEIEDIIHGSLDHGRVREAEAQLSLLNELMEIK